MGKTVKTVLKIAAGAAIAVFAPMLAPALLAAVGTTTATALATTVASAAIGAAAGEASGIGWKAGLAAGSLGGAQSSGLFGGGAAAGGSTAAGAAPEAAGALTPTVQAGVTTPALTSTGGAIGSGTGLSTASSAAPAAAGTAGTVAGAAPAAAGAAAPATLGGTLSGIATRVGQAGLAGLKTVAPQVAAQVLAGAPGAGLARAQREELARAQQANASLVQARLAETQKLMGEADYFDPDYMGRQAAEAAMIRGGIQTAENTRGLTGERLAAERRRYNLGTARTAGTAYQQGALTGANARYTARTAGLAAMPTEYPTTNPAGALAAQNIADERKAATEKGLSELFGSILEPKKPVTT